MELNLYDYIALAMSRLDRFFDLNNPESLETIIHEWRSEDEDRTAQLEALDAIIETLIMAKTEIEKERGS